MLINAVCCVVYTADIILKTRIHPIICHWIRVFFLCLSDGFHQRQNTNNDETFREYKL